MLFLFGAIFGFLFRHLLVICLPKPEPMEVQILMDIKAVSMYSARIIFKDAEGNDTGTIPEGTTIVWGQEVTLGSSVAEIQTNPDDPTRCSFKGGDAGSEGFVMATVTLADGTEIVARTTTLRAVPDVWDGSSIGIEVTEN